MTVEDWMAGINGQMDALITLTAGICATLPQANELAHKLKQRIAEQQAKLAQTSRAQPYIQGMNTTLAALQDQLAMAAVAALQGAAGSAH